MRRHGDPDVLVLEESSLPPIRPGTALVRVEFSGVNFFDVRQRKGDSSNTPPITLGIEGAGVVEALADASSPFHAGQRVAWQGLQGTYATHAVVPTGDLVALPETITTRVAAASLLQGLVAHVLGTTIHPLRPGDVCLIHAVAGGVGGLLCQIAK